MRKVSDIMLEQDKLVVVVAVMLYACDCISGEGVKNTENYAEEADRFVDKILATLKRKRGG